METNQLPWSRRPLRLENKFPFNRLSEDLRTPSGNQHIQLHWPQAIEGHLIRPTQEDPLFLLMPLRLQFMGRPTTGIPHPLEQRPQWTGSLRNSPHSQPPLMEARPSPPELALNKLLTSATLCDTLVFSTVSRAVCLQIMDSQPTVQCSRMASSISSTTCSPSTMFGK